MRNCYLSRNYKGVDGAGNKAKTDIECIMAENGFVNVGFRQTRYTNPVLAFLATLAGVLKAPFSLRKGDRLVLQYPLKKYFTFVCRMAHFRGAKVVVVIHDLGSFRSKRLTPLQEIRRLNNADVIIVHTEEMKEWLKQHEIRAKLVVLGVFDYLSESVPAAKTVLALPYTVAFVGGLDSRNYGFLYEMINSVHSYRLMLYGNGLEEGKVHGKVDYRGFVMSDNLISSAGVVADFGLVWYGYSLEGGKGDSGEYLRYNAPHKLSLYIRCGLPIIIWDKAGLADFVREHHIGICLSSLKDLDDVLSELTPEAYAVIKQNVVEMSRKISAGEFCTKAIRQALGMLEG